MGEWKSQTHFQQKFSVKVWPGNIWLYWTILLEWTIWRTVLRHLPWITTAAAARKCTLGNKECNGTPAYFAIIYCSPKSMVWTWRTSRKVTKVSKLQYLRFPLLRFFMWLYKTYASDFSTSALFLKKESRCMNIKWMETFSTTFVEIVQRLLCLRC